MTQKTKLGAELRLFRLPYVQREAIFISSVCLREGRNFLGPVFEIQRLALKR